MRPSLAWTIFVSVGVVLAALFLTPLWLVIRGGPNVGATLGLLRYYLPGYTVTWPGAFLGFFYGVLIGGIVGWIVAFIYNQIVARRSTPPS